MNMLSGSNSNQNDQGARSNSNHYFDNKLERIRESLSSLSNLKSVHV
jgi:alpha/beta superfamily hydrolase